VLAVPARHIHSHSAILYRDDFDGLVRLRIALVRKLEAATVAGLTP
jgi:endoglucanase